MKKPKKRKLTVERQARVHRVGVMTGQPANAPSGGGMEVLLPFTNADAHFFLSRDGVWKARVVWSGKDGSQKQRYIDAGGLVHKIFSLAVMSRATRPA